MIFVKKVAIVALFVIVLLLLKSTFSVLLMILAATIIALYFHGLAGLIKRKVKLSHKWSMFLSITGSFIIIGLLFWLIGSRVQSQISTMSEKLPAIVDQAKTQLSHYSWGRTILDQTSGPNSEKLVSSAKRFFNSTFGVLGDIYVILFLGIFLTADPSTYRNGIIALIPKQDKEQGRHVLDKLGQTLKSWFKGKLFSMAVVAVLTGIGLSILGVPLVFALAIIAGALNFIPNLGPIIAMVPAVLIGLTLGVNTALIIAGLYILIQMIESNIITPMVQKKLVSIPPALIIIGQLIVGSVTGYLGII
ncbi:AI-2E family transporter [Pedobacter sp. P351]|uniref:AI-2E family transporter n=1 Tax=Pedobacter superstes TaxID=3133441 RepID=UPI0030AAD766